MPIRVGDILTRASITLNDEDFIRWTKAELYGWVNDGACEIVLRRPAARAVTLVMSLIAGTFQRLPDGGLWLLDITRSISADGNAVKTVRRIDRQLLDDQKPDWHSIRKSSAIVKHYTFDEATPTTFYVYPAATAGAKVEAVISEAPPLIEDDEDFVDLDRAYIGPIVSYVMYRSLAKDSEYANAAMATAHFQAFTEALGSQNQVTDAASPNTRKS